LNRIFYFIFNDLWSLKKDGEEGGRAFYFFVKYIVLSNIQGCPLSLDVKHASNAQLFRHLWMSSDDAFTRGDSPDG
jgi:hypothetical protein